jgi:hypothetical protein
LWPENAAYNHPGAEDCHRVGGAKKPRLGGRGFNWIVKGGDFDILGMPGDDLLSHDVVPSAQERFTVEFGMGSSGGVPLLSPGKRRMLDHKRGYRLCSE